jgi:predicted amidophosphoribosyltransferase
MSEDADVRGKTVLLVDDIYQSGFTLNEVGRVLFEAGAESVLGLVATKTGRDM